MPYSRIRSGLRTGVMWLVVVSVVTPLPPATSAQEVAAVPPEALYGSGRAPDLMQPAVLEAFFDGAVRPLMKDNRSPSGVVVVAHSGDVIFAKGYGFKDGDARTTVDPSSTLFRPGSVSKLFTWVSVMQLVEAGELDLDADVNDYLAGFRIRDTFEQPVTLRHIMTHTTGFEDGGLGYLIIEDPERAVSLQEAMQRYQPVRVNPPGVQTAYSNYGAALAGLIVETVSGLPFNDYVQQRIFEPLGMQRATFEEPLPERLADAMATSYAFESGAFVEKPFEIIASFAPAGSLSATGTDMLRFAEAIRNGGELDGRRILRPETVEAMLTRNFSHDDRMMGMALGFYEDDYAGTRIMGHGGDTQWFHSQLGIDLEHDLTWFVSFGAPGGAMVRTAVMQTFYDEFYPRPEDPPVPPQDFGDRAARYTGSYGFWRTNFSTIEKTTGLGGAIDVAPAGNNTLIVSSGGDAKRYAEVGPNLFREMDSGVALVAGLSPRLIAFQEDDAGEIVGLVIDGLPFMSLRKLPRWATPSFNFTLLGLAFAVFLGVLLRRFFQRAAIREMSSQDRSAVLAGVLASGANWLVLIVGVLVVSAVQDRLVSQMPLALKLWLVLPIVAVGVTVLLLYRTVGVWSGGLLSGPWARLRYTVVTLCALSMCWFYWYWNILGFQYM